MVTLAPFLFGTKNSKEESLQRCISVLLQGMGRHVARIGTPSESADYEASLRRLREQVSKAKDPDDILVIAGSAVQELAASAESAARRFEETQQAWRGIAEVMLHCLDAATPSPQEEPGLAESFAAAIHAAGSAEDIHALRMRLEQHLADLSDSAAAAPVLAADPRLASRIYADSAPEETDPATGLPGARVAQRALSARWKSRGNGFVVAFVLERLEAINIRFGCNAGDQVIQNYSQNLVQYLGPDDQLFRWSGPCLLALIDRELPEGLVTSEIARISALRLEQAVVVRNREVIVPVSPAWSVFALAEYASVEEVGRKVDEFIDERLLACFGTPSGRR